MPWDYLLTIRMTLQPDFCKAVLTLKDASPATSMMHGDVLWKPAILTGVRNSYQLHGARERTPDCML